MFTARAHAFISAVACAIALAGFTGVNALTLPQSPGSSISIESATPVSSISSWSIGRSESATPVSSISSWSIGGTESATPVSSISSWSIGGTESATPVSSVYFSSSIIPVAGDLSQPNAARGLVSPSFWVALGVGAGTLMVAL